MRVAMISEHASPLAHLGGVDAGGQNVAVAELSAALARRGSRTAPSRASASSGLRVASASRSGMIFEASG